MKNYVAPTFIDIEASGLYPESYPIEVGFCSQDRSTSFLINPSTVKDWQGHWDIEAEALHGISLRQLRREGVTPFEACRQLNRQLPRVVYSDNPDFDEKWIEELYFVCRATPSFRVACARDYIKTAAAHYHQSLTSIDFSLLMASARKRLNVTAHRALADARVLHEAHRMICTLPSDKLLNVQ